MPPIQTTHRPAPSRTRATIITKPSATEKAKPDNKSLPKPAIDDLAARVADLSITNSKEPTTTTKGKRNDGAQARIAAMRAVNTALQSLSAVVQGGWKASGKKSSLGGEAVSAAGKAEETLKVLRVACPGDVDVERAASSVVAKLIILEMVCLVFSVV